MACWPQEALVMRQTGSARMRRSESWSSGKALMQRIRWCGLKLGASSGMNNLKMPVTAPKM
jgi:hypothetical protein